MYKYTVAHCAPRVARKIHIFKITKYLNNYRWISDGNKTKIRYLIICAFIFLPYKFMTTTNIKIYNFDRKSTLLHKIYRHFLWNLTISYYTITILHYLRQKFSICHPNFHDRWDF